MYCLKRLVGWVVGWPVIVLIDTEREREREREELKRIIQNMFATWPKQSNRLHVPLYTLTLIIFSSIIPIMHCSRTPPLCMQTFYRDLPSCLCPAPVTNILRSAVPSGRRYTIRCNDRTTYLYIYIYIYTNPGHWESSHHPRSVVRPTEPGFNPVFTVRCAISIALHLTAAAEPYPSIHVRPLFLSRPDADAESRSAAAVASTRPV